MPRFTTLYSGSSGNCGVIEEAGRYVLVDMGGSCRATTRALLGLGLDIEGLAGILVTHEHSDHVKGLEVFLRKNPAPVLATAATLDALWYGELVPESAELVEAEGRQTDLGGFLVEAFPTSHDAAGCCGFRVVTPSGAVMAIATDLGKMTAEVFTRLEGAALVALEANYDPWMLAHGSYPPALKTRIASTRGHLANPDAAAAVAQLVAAGCRRVALCHLSEENNLPEKVHEALDAAFASSGLRRPEDCVLQVARRYEPSDWMDF